jgi:hypothetical protein
LKLQDGTKQKVVSSEEGANDDISAKAKLAINRMLEIV